MKELGPAYCRGAPTLEVGICGHKGSWWESRALQLEPTSNQLPERGAAASGSRTERRYSDDPEIARDQGPQPLPVALETGVDALELISHGHPRVIIIGASHPSPFGSGTRLAGIILRRRPDVCRMIATRVASKLVGLCRHLSQAARTMRATGSASTSRDGAVRSPSSARQLQPSLAPRTG